MAKIFEELVIQRKQLAGYNKYRIYKSEKDFIEVSATTVQEALETSGIKDALKIVINSLSGLPVIDAGILMEKPETQPAAEAAPPPAAPPAAPEATST